MGLDLTKKYIEVIDRLKEIEEEHLSIDDKMRTIEVRLQDVIHFIEDCGRDINEKQAMKLIALQQDLRTTRRNLKKEWEMRKVFNDENKKLAYAQQLDILRRNLLKKENSLITQYKPREWSYEAIIGMITPTGKRGRPSTKDFFKKDEELI